MKQYVLTILITGILTWSITYALSQETTQEKLERENKAILETYAKEQRDCYDNATGSSIEISQKYDLCSIRPKPKLKTISWDWNSGSVGEVIKINWTHSTGSTVPPSLEDTRMLICKKVPTSPLCNKENFEMAQAISYRKALIWGVDDKEKFFRVGIGIMFAESTLWTKFAWTCDSSYNNFWWIKYRILDTWEAVRDQKIPQNGCWVYKFATLEDYFGSKYNSLGKGYGSCFKKKDAVNCIAYAYVWNPNVAETSWQNNVNTFLN